MLRTNLRKESVTFLRRKRWVAGAACWWIATTPWVVHAAPPTPVPETQRPTVDWLSTLQFGRRDLPIEVAADSFEFDYKNHVLRYRGNVRAQQGDVVIQAIEMLVLLDGGRTPQLREVRAKGEVRIVQGDRWAQADEAVFDQNRRTATLAGNVHLHDAANEISGARLVVYLDQNRTVMEGNGATRVKAVFYPASGTQDPDR